VPTRTRIRTCPLGLLLAALLTSAPAAASAAPTPDLELLMCQAAREQHLTQIRRRQFGYFMDDVIEKVSSKGVVKDRETKTRYVHRSENGVPVNQLILQDGVLSETERLEAEQGAKRRLARLKVDRKERRSSIEREEKKVRNKAGDLQYARGSLLLRLEGVDDIGGVPCWVVSFRPDPRFRGEKKGFLHKSTGIFWIGMEQPAFLRLELDFHRKASIGLGALATLARGSHLVSELVAPEPGVYLVSFVDMEMKLKVLFVANKRERRMTRYREFVRVLEPWPEFAP
jgi:hypothetical protein